MQPQISGAPSCSSTGPVFWSYSYDKGSLPPSTEKALMSLDDSPKIINEPVDTQQLNRLVAAAMYNSIKQSMPYILQTQYNWTPESGPFYMQGDLQQQQQQQQMFTPSPQPAAAVPTTETTTAPKEQRQRPRRGCC